jgi:cell division protein FtsW
MRKVIATLLTCAALLTGLGVIFVASASTVRSASLHRGDPHWFLMRQIAWLAVAMALGLFAAKFDYHHWQKQRWLQIALLAAVFLGLAAVFPPSPIAVGRINGSYRWVGLGPVRFQPSELAKLATVILVSVWMSGLGWRVRTFWRGFALPLGVLAVVLGLLILEPDFGAMFVTAVVGMALLFVAGARVLYIAAAGVSGAGVFLALVLHDTVRCERLLVYVVKAFGAASFLTEWLAGLIGRTPEQVLQDVAASNKKHQAEQSRLAFINGGPLGVGLNNSMQKHYYLPEAYTDFIYAIAGEEWGLPATLGILLAFGAILVCGLLIAARAPDRLGRLLAFGLTLLLVFQAFFNIGVVTDCLPTKGLALPFISYGGSNLITAFVAIGMLVNIATHVLDPDAHTRAQLHDGPAARGA